ncbi:MAG TPA: DUF294 nucleotidyltransferase-like domain-containing protein, partial [Desulfobacteraceae bacterium]|nr:DUF294 nucleotidyltransferase-like domain-containing protein [Desulfobacteraceae bacterium]
MRQKDLLTIADTVPFSLLPKETMEVLDRDFSVTEHKKGTLLFVQGKSKVEHLYLVARGAVERYFEDDRGKILRARLGEGEIYGGISILMNEGVSVRTLTVAEDSIFYTLPAEKFRELCAAVTAFREYFTNTFGKLMENRSYAGMIAMQKSESSLSFFNRPVSAIFKPNLVSCPAGDSIQAAAVKMTKNSTSAIFIRNKENRIQGIVTDSDLRQRVIARGHDIASPVSEIMSDSLVTVDADAQVFEAYLLLMQNNLNHLPVRNRSGRITGVLTDNDFMAAQGKSPYLLIKEIKTATRFEQLEKIHDRLPGMLLDPIKNGSNTENLTKFITAFSDAILDKIIRFAIESKGRPPCRFAFMVMGSEGREEQTLKTDQDNAIVYEDPADEVLQKKAEEYFKELAHTVCTWLDRAGFEFCQGNNMAMNPDWCQPLSVWKSCFSKWIHAADPEDLL